MRIRPSGSDKPDAELGDIADEELMQLVRRADPRAFELVYDRHCGAAFGLAYRMVGTRGLAEDVVQEAFLALWRGASRYDGARGSVRSWVLGIVHNRAIDALRRTLVHERRRASDEGIDGPLRGRRAHRGRGRRATTMPRFVRAALDTLPTDQRARRRARLLQRLHAHRDRRGASTPRSGRSRDGCGSACSKLRDELGREGVTP